MVVAYFDVEGVAVHETKADSPLFVDRNRMLAFAITSETMQPVAGGDLEVAESSCRVDLLELAYGPDQDLRG